MKPAFFSLLLLVQTPAVQAEASEARTAQPRAVVKSTEAPRAWLGLRVEKPDETVTAHVPSLPPGIGFLVKSIDEGGPAQSAGLKELDLLWKIGDQLLVNEAQLATLLRLSKPGDDVVLAGFRGGKPLEVKLKLGLAPTLKHAFTGEMVESAILPGACGGPMRVVNVAEKSASYSTDEGHAVVRREDDRYHVKITGPDDAVLFDGTLAKDGSGEGLPDGWSRKIRVLCRTLDRTLDSDMMPQREPRPRVVPPASTKP